MSDPAGFSWATAVIDEGLLVRVGGEIDMADAPRLAETLASCAGDSVIVDLSGVTFLGSAGLNALVAAHKYVDHRGGRLVIRGSSPMIVRLMEITGLDQYLHLEPAATGDQA